MAAKAQTRVEKFLQAAQRREDAVRARRVRRIARAHSLIATSYHDEEITQMERIVAAAYGRLQMEKLR